MSLITAPGAYADIDNEDYHRNPDLLPGPSLSSSGAKRILSASPYHYWFDSPLNPNRPPEQDKSHYAIGKAAHDLILLADRWADHYHILPEGFTRAATKKFAEAIAAADEAIEAGKTVLKHDDHLTAIRVADALSENNLAMTALSKGVTEETIVWQDAETGVWLRARPDFRPDSIVSGGPVRVLADLKFMSPTFCSPHGFGRAIDNFGYHQSAAFYFEGIRQVYGEEPTHWLNIVCEKAEKPSDPVTVSLYELPSEDIHRGRLLNRQAIRIFADCLSADRWPAYADGPMPVGLPEYARKRIDFSVDAPLSEAA